MNGLRLVLFGVNSDAGFGHEPRRPLAFFLGGAPAPLSPLLPEWRTRAFVEDPEKEIA